MNTKAIIMYSLLRLCITFYTKKGKGCSAPPEHRRGAHLPVSGRWAHRWIDHKVYDAWPVWRQTYGYLPSRRASPPLGWYQIILLGDRGTWVWTTCLELLLDSVPTGNRTHDLLIASLMPYRYATKPLSILVWIIYISSSLQLLCDSFSNNWRRNNDRQQNRPNIHGSFGKQNTSSGINNGKIMIVISWMVW